MSANRYSSVHVEPAAEEEYEPPARHGSWVPLVFSLFAGLIVIGLLAVVLLSPQQSAGAGANPAATKNPAQVEALRVGAYAPDFTLPGMNGGVVTLSSFRGVKPVWINFWATWCTYCKQEMPEMQKLYDQHKGEGLEILGVDDLESQPAVQQYVQLGKYNWDFVLDLNGIVDAQYRVTGLPTHIFIDKSGIIKDIVIGGIQQDRMVSELGTLLTP